jgi:cell wall-active antibiotic response 4TMS protein YvqF
MKCAFHADVDNTAFCIRCGKPLCAQCVRQVQSSIYCETCLSESLGGSSAAAGSAAGAAGPAAAAGIANGPMPRVQAAGGSSPEAAFLLGLIPGVGAIYNAEYIKAALHVLIFATLVSIGDASHGSADAFWGLLAFGFYIYMPFEAFYTAKKRKLAREGINLITPFDNFSEQFGDLELWGGILLVVLGGILLLHTFDIVPLERIARLWPVLLIVVGLFCIRRFTTGKKA